MEKTIVGLVVACIIMIFVTIGCITKTEEGTIDPMEKLVFKLAVVTALQKNQYAIKPMQQITESLLDVIDAGGESTLINVDTALNDEIAKLDMTPVQLMIFTDIVEIIKTNVMAIIEDKLPRVVADNRALKLRNLVVVLNDCTKMVYIE